MDIPADNLIKKCLETSLDPESLAKFQQVLDHLGEHYYVPLYRNYNKNLYQQLEILSNGTTQFPPNYPLQNHVSLKIHYLSFKFIKNVGRFIRTKSDCSEKSEASFLTLIKILLFHSLTTKNFTASLALVEIEQLCLEYQTTLQSLYQRYRAKFLRLIIKAVLHKLMTTSEGDFINGNSSNGAIRPSNRVITYMIRALEVFNITTITNDDFTKSLIIITNLIHKEKYNDAIKRLL